MTATAIGGGVVAGGFVVAGLGLLRGRTRMDLEGTALRDGFWGGFSGICCLLLDLLLGYAWQ